MPELNFCPFCDAPRHKLLLFNEHLFFCKTCNKFFNLEERQLKCPKCSSAKVEDSDFPAPNGEVVFQCSRCRKMFAARDFLEKNLKLLNNDAITAKK